MQPPSPKLLAKCRTGILFSGPMMLALLSGQKTVTRRMSRTWLRLGVGDLLYTREAWAPCDGWVAFESEGLEPPRNIAYRADSTALGLRLDGSRFVVDTSGWNWGKFSWKPSIHQKRDYSRCVLRLTEAPRLEHVQDITEDDARREGVNPIPGFTEPGDPPEWTTHAYRTGFRGVWEHLHDKDGERWIENVEVVRLAFERIA